MTGEIITMIGVGLALAAFNWRVMVRFENRLEGRMDRLEYRLDGRMDRIDGRIDLLDGRINELRKEVHELGREFSELRGEMRGGGEGRTSS